MLVPEERGQSRVQLVKEFAGAAAVVTLAQGEEMVMRTAKVLCHGFRFLLVTLEIEGMRRDCSTCVGGAVQGITEKMGLFFIQNTLVLRKEKPECDFSENIYLRKHRNSG